eukprot:TRINITY_DN1464_c0_g1_i2.p1 TRINITY_DN1464_c0_g1~~TRINITY_DN1464_c0_g1_i2.p1  ORF type:complete len:293 (-),score=59.04 TRINITY_DN1464_c0_g1_i2:81-959(-)
MVLEERAIPLFAPTCLTIMAEPWRALSVMSGSAGFTSESTGLLNKISAIFAKAKIPIYYISTAQTDFILVREGDLESAVLTLESSYCVLKEEHSGGGLSSSHDSHHSTEIGILSTEFDQTIVSHQNDTPTIFEPVPQLEWTLHDHLQLHISSLSKENRETCAHSLLKVLFFSKGKFFSFTETDDEISLLMEADMFSLFENDALCVSDEWLPLERFEKRNLSEIGVISFISQILSKAKIPILYLSTYQTSFVMIRSSDLAVTKLWLETAQYKIVTHQEKLERKLLEGEKRLSA